MNFNLSITTTATLTALRDVDEFQIEGEGFLATVYVHVATDGYEAWGIPLVTTVTVAAEVWSDGMDDDGPGEPVTDAAGIAALLGCSPEGLAAHLDEMVGDRSLAAYEARYDY